VNILTTATRLLLGAGLAFAGASMYLFGNPPPQPGLAGQFDAVFFASHYALFVGAAQLAIGVLLLVNRFVPVALVMLAAFVYNSFAFHATMAPSALWAPFVLIALALPTALRYRAAFAAFFTAAPASYGRPAGYADSPCGSVGTS